MSYIASPQWLDKVAASIRADCWMVAPLMPEIATIWLESGEAEHLISLQHRTIGALDHAAPRNRHLGLSNGAIPRHFNSHTAQRSTMRRIRSSSCRVSSTLLSFVPKIRQPIRAIDRVHAAAFGRPIASATMTASSKPVSLTALGNIGTPFGANQLSSFGEDGFGNLYVMGINGDVFRIAAVPEPISGAMLVAGLALVATCVRRRSAGRG